MEKLVIMKNEQAVTTSLQVAETFSKEHKVVMRAIKNLAVQNCTVEKMFVESTYVDSRGHEQPMYYMNRDGFTLLAMGFTGDKALQFKLKYIDAFNEMEQFIKEQALPQTPDEKIQLLLEATAEDAKDRKKLNERVTKVEKTVADIKDKAEVDEGQRYQLLQARKAKVISVCGGKESNYYIEKKAGKVFNAFGSNFKKAFKIPRYDCLKAKDFEKAMEFTKNWYPDFNTQSDIQRINAQIRLDLYREEK